MLIFPFVALLLKMPRISYHLQGQQKRFIDKGRFIRVFAAQKFKKQRIRLPDVV
jgi:hypothetical protein